MYLFILYASIGAVLLLCCCCCCCVDLMVVAATPATAPAPLRTRLALAGTTLLHTTHTLTATAPGATMEGTATRAGALRPRLALASPTLRYTSGAPATATATATALAGATSQQGIIIFIIFVRHFQKNEPSLFVYKQNKKKLLPITLV
jgi:hypothetical protein